MAELENVMEEKLIEQLCYGPSQWKRRPDIVTEDDLWKNLRKQLNINNTAVLDGVEITDSEMSQIKEFILDKALSTYKAALWLSGEHGVAQIPLVREDARLGTISLMAVNNREIAGGKSTYEVINQYQAKKTESTDRNRRFDVTLLINGLPMIHIELKNRNHPAMDAFRQIQKYEAEGKFRGLFGLVQMYVVSNGVDTLYIAADRPNPLNEKFLIGWVDENNKPVADYLEFARKALNIPAAHNMIGKYSVLDSEKKKLILLRPYQIHAIEAVKEASKQKKSGYIWHTTGSGKTLTSFNVTNNLLDIPGIDKTLFLIDRKDLDEQTSRNFTSYAQYADLQIDKTEYTGDLEEKLLNKDRQAIVTTVQKLQRILSKYSESFKSDKIERLKKENVKLQAKIKSEEDASVIEDLKNKIDLNKLTIENELRLIEKLQYDRGASNSSEEQKQASQLFKKMLKLKSKNLAFVVDECHRTVSPETKQYIEEFFDNPQHKSLWYGFTGTPLFDVNNRNSKGNLARTTLQEYAGEIQTKDKYGNLVKTLVTDTGDGALHKYTIKDALHDGAVLGFKIDYRGESRDQLLSIARTHLKDKTDEELDELKDDELEKYVMNGIKAITGKDFYDNDDHRNLVIDYIVNKCQERFRLHSPVGTAYAAILTVSSIADAQRYYQLFKKFIAEGKVKETIKQQLADFPKIAITYSVGENEDGAFANQTMMKESIKDYNEMFGTKWTLENIDAYNSDLNARLSRKESRYKNRKEQLDLVIVVDRLLTGFDAPCISTIFLDRPPLNYQGLIQAFSRTNRIFDKNKRHGNVITLQTPAIYQKVVEKAIDLYSNGGSNEVCAPTYEQIKVRMKKAAKELKDFAKSASDIDLNDPIDKLIKFVELFQKFDHLLDQIKIYDEWESENQLSVTKFNEKEIEDFVGKYVNVLEILKGDKPLPEERPIDLDYVLESVHVETIDYNYLINLIQSHIEDDKSTQTQIAQQAVPEEKPETTEETKSVEDPQIDKFIELIGKQNQHLADVIKDVWTKVKTDPSEFKGQFADNLVRDRIDQIIEEKLGVLAEELCINLEDLKFKALTWSEGKKLTVEADYDKYISKGGTLSKLKYNREIRERAEQVIKEEILPLLKR